MTDLISKSAAINTTFNMCCRWDGEDRDDLRNMMLTAFQELPTIDAVPVKRAKLVNPNPFGECSICGYLIDVREEYRYCPMCGAKMERSEDDKTAN